MIVDRVVRWYRSARCHRIGKIHAMNVIGSVELEIVALERDDAIVVIHVMPTSLRRRGREQDQ